jgi:hypothetical protein
MKLLLGAPLLALSVLVLAMDIRVLLVGTGSGSLSGANPSR